MAGHYAQISFPVAFVVPAPVFQGQRITIANIRQGDILRSMEAFLPDVFVTGYIAFQGSSEPVLVAEILDGGWHRFRPLKDFSPVPNDSILEYVVDTVVAPIAVNTPANGLVMVDRQVVNGYTPIPIPPPVAPGADGVTRFLYSAEMQWAREVGRTSFQDGVRHINAGVKADLFSRKLDDNKYGNVANNMPIYISRLLRRDRLTSITIGLEKASISDEGLAVCLGTLAEPGRFFAGRITAPSRSFFADVRIRHMMASELDKDTDIYLFLPEARELAQVPGETVFGRINYVRN